MIARKHRYDKRKFFTSRDILADKISSDVRARSCVPYACTSPYNWTFLFVVFKICASHPVDVLSYCTVWPAPVCSISACKADPVQSILWPIKYFLDDEIVFFFTCNWDWSSIWRLPLARVENFLSFYVNMKLGEMFVTKTIKIVPSLFAVVGIVICVKKRRVRMLKSSLFVTLKTEKRLQLKRKKLYVSLSNEHSA